MIKKDEKSMKNKGNKGVTLMSLIITIVILMFITGSIIFNTQNHLSMSKINKLRLDIDALNAKVDEYYLKLHFWYVQMYISLLQNLLYEDNHIK